MSRMGGSVCEKAPARERIGPAILKIQNDHGIARSAKWLQSVHAAIHSVIVAGDPIIGSAGGRILS